MFTIAIYILFCYWFFWWLTCSILLLSPFSLLLKYLFIFMELIL